ncbi:MAG: CARDB domain-containing protein, partial [Pyrinomonadaceae bacterium]
MTSLLLVLVCAPEGFSQSAPSADDGPVGDRFTTTRTVYDGKKYPPLPPGYTALHRTVFILHDKTPEQSWSFIKFRFPSITDPVVFAKIRILRLIHDFYTANDAEWFDRTFIEPFVNLPDSGIPHLPNFATKIVQSDDDSMGTYVLALYDPSALGTADLSISAVVAPLNPQPDTDANITVTVSNGGPHAAENARAWFKLDGRTQIVSVKSSLGTCTEKHTLVFCTFGDIAVGASAQVFIVAKPGNEQDSWPDFEGSIWRHEYR